MESRASQRDVSVAIRRTKLEMLRFGEREARIKEKTNKRKDIISN